MKKILTALGIILVLLVVLIFVLFTMFGNKALKMGIETGGTAALKVPVSLQDANLSILGGKVELAGLNIKNPEGYQLPDFMSMGKAAVALNIKSLLSETIEIQKIQLDDIQLTLEQKGLSENNLQAILNNLPKSDKPAETTTETPGKKLVIRELVINGVQVKAKLLPIPGKADTVTLKVNPIVLKDIGNDKPVNTAELISKVLTAIAGGVAEQGKDLLPLDMIDSIGKGLAEQGQKILQTGQQALEGIGEAGKGALEEVGKTGENILKGAGDVGKGATDALKGIFDQKKE
ncbi:MAG: AsmA family protein [Sedimentisphaerales bacterium]|nr:AsmA family protein [Sedimentisphaerales bacterium]